MNNDESAPKCKKCHGMGWIAKGHGNDEQCDCIFVDPPESIATPEPAAQAGGTPRTDVEELTAAEISPPCHVVPSHVARELERQLASALLERDDNLQLLLTVAATSVESLVNRHLRLLEQLNEKDLPVGFESWEAFMRHIDGIKAERDAGQEQLREARKDSGLERILAWFDSHCDGDREHSSGIKIHTTDNPGVFVEIDLEGTPEAALSIKQTSDMRDGEITIETHDLTLHGYCEPPTLLPGLLNEMAVYLATPHPQQP